jgi:hypothetical protein
LGQYENYFFKRLNGKITHLAIGKGIYIYLAICQPRYDFRKCLFAGGGGICVAFQILSKKPKIP